MGARIEIIGRRYGTLTVREFISRDEKRKEYYLCDCDCGNTITAMKHILMFGKRTSCGCKKGQATIKHGCGGKWIKTPEYRAWRAMIDRCTLPSSIGYLHYGGRGISVCDRWRHDFPAFLHDMGLKPSPKHSLDRENNDGNYEPGNCRWATPHQQARNRSDNHVLEYGGLSMPITDWAAKIGVPMATLHSRITKLGYSVEKALTFPYKPKQQLKKDAA